MSIDSAIEKQFVEILRKIRKDKEFALTEECIQFVRINSDYIQENYDHFSGLASMTHAEIDQEESVNQKGDLV